MSSPAKTFGSWNSFFTFVKNYPKTNASLTHARRRSAEVPCLSRLVVQNGRLPGADRHPPRSGERPWRVLSRLRDQHDSNTESRLTPGVIRADELG